MMLILKTPLSNTLFAVFLLTALAACSTPEQQAEKYYAKGMALLEKSPDKARLEFSNALQIKKNMTKAMYGIALVAERKGEWKMAFDAMNQVLEQDPKHVDSLVKTGQILLAGGKIELALERSDKAFTLDNNDVGALNLRAALKLQLNDAAGAVEYANMALLKQPGNKDAYMVLATERLAAKDNVKAIEYFDKVLVKDEKNIVIQLIKIKTLENMSKVVEAENGFKKLIQQQPDLGFVRKSYAQFLINHNRKNDAEQQLREFAKASQIDIQPKLDIVRFLIATKGIEAGQAELESLVKTQPKNYELAFALVSLYQIQKDMAQEGKLLNQIVENAGNSSDGFKAKSLIAYNLIQQGKKDEASKLLDTILDVDKANGQALTIRASLAIDAKNFSAAISDLRTVLRDTPQASGAALMLASVYESSDSLELAEEQYTKAFVSGKFSEKFGLPYVQFLLRNKKTERAEKALQTMLDANPNNQDVLGALAQVKILRGDFDGAKALAAKAKQSSKSSLADQILGAISSSKNDVDGSIVAYLRAHESDPKDLKPIAAIVNTYMQAGKSAEALAFVVSVLKVNPDYIEIKLMQGQIYASIGDNLNASNIFTEIIKAQPNHPLAYRELAIANMRANRPAEAEKTITMGIAVIPKDLELKLVQANIHESNKRYEEAIKTYEEILKIRPNSIVAANNLASLLLDNREDKASLDRAYELAKSNKNSQIPQLIDTFGWANYKLGMFDEAEKLLMLAVKKLPDDPVFHFHLAKVYMAKNDKTQAKQALEQAVKHADAYNFDKKQEAETLLKTL